MGTGIPRVESKRRRTAAFVRVQLDTVLNWGLESPQNRQTRMSAPREPIAKLRSGVSAERRQPPVSKQRRSAETPLRRKGFERSSRSAGLSAFAARQSAAPARRRPACGIGHLSRCQSSRVRIGGSRTVSSCTPLDQPVYSKTLSVPDKSAKNDMDATVGQNPPAETWPGDQPARDCDDRAVGKRLR